MADWGSSLFLQALGWATLNSFWQMALLWCIFQVATHFVKTTSNRKYLFAVYSVFLGFSWFIYNLITYYNSGLNNMALSTLNVEVSTSQLSLILSAASITYLILLIFPSYTIICNWLKLKRIKKFGLLKAPFNNRLFTKKIAQHLGIKKPVQVYLSQWISSPMTVGFFKPVILIPVAALNNLTVQQLEAILLHELSHIKRQDYIINLLLSLIQTFLYFNPFLKLFIKRIEIERENCCDELVLQFEYDKHGYAAALLQLEKNTHEVPALVMAAAHKNHLLHRIEKIVGVQRKPVFNTTHFAGAFAAVLMLFVINSILIAGKEKLVHNSINHFSEPYTFFTNERDEESDKTKVQPDQQHLIIQTASDKQENHLVTVTSEPSLPIIDYYEQLPANNNFLQVALDENEAALSKDQKEMVGKTIENTKQVLEKNWREIEKSIADGMTSYEKIAAKQEYLKEVEKIDWNKLEKGLKIQYQNINWEELNSSLAQSLVMAEIDSVKEVYNKVSVELHKMKMTESCPAVVAMPDASIKQIEKAKAEVKQRIEEINKLKAKKTIVSL